MLANKTCIIDIEKKSHLTACEMPLTYIKNKSGPVIKPGSRLQGTDAGLEKLFLKLTRNDLLNK